MSRIAYVNGRYLPLAMANVNVEDRGYQFSDGVYEVCEVREGRLVDERRHMLRLAFSLGELRIAMPMSPASLGVVLREVVHRNRVRWGIVYLQITRGVSRRDHAFPPAGTLPSIVVTARNMDFAAAEKMAENGVAVISVPENRWERVDIKSVSLLPNVLAKQAAREQGAREAWFVDRERPRHRGLVIERLDRDPRRQGGHPSGRPWHPQGHHPDGRARRHRIARAEARRTRFHDGRGVRRREAFVTSASQIVLPVVKIDGRPVGNGAPGLIASALRRDFHRHAETT